jgi:hypothetical protein
MNRVSSFCRSKCTSPSFHLFIAFLSLLIATVIHDSLVTFISATVMSSVLVDSPSAAGYAPFVSSTDPNAGTVVSKFWFFNTTNVDDVVLRGARPIVVEVGPLSYLYTNTKVNVTFDKQADTITYVQVQQYVPADSETIALQESIVFVPDLLLLGALSPLSGLADFVPILFPTTKDPRALFTGRSMRDFLWGYYDSTLLIRFPGIQMNDSSIEAAVATHGKNTVRIGAGAGYGEMMNFVAWDNMQSMQCCVSGPAGEKNAAASGGCGSQFGTLEGDSVRGSFGNSFHPGIQPDETLHLTTNDFGMYRTWPFLCEEGNAGAGSLNDGSELASVIGACESYDLLGARLSAFRLPSWVMGNASVSKKEAAAFGGGRDSVSGILNQTSCYTGSPVMISRPHFLYGSNSLFDFVQSGMSIGDETTHGSFLGIEPITGNVLDFAFRAQYNAAPHRVDTSTFSYFTNISYGVFPIAWGEQRAIVTPAQVQQFTGWLGLYFALRVAAVMRWGGIALAAAAVAAAAFFISRKMWAPKVKESEVLFGEQFYASLNE